MSSSSHFLAAAESRLRPLLVRLPPAVVLRIYSRGRRFFLGRLVRERPEPRPVPESLGRELWGLRFRAPLFNAAGMFKEGRGYEVCVRQGAGAWLAGTTTATPRPGNVRHGIHQPFAPYPASGAASNWLGLPNAGHAEVARRLGELEALPGCPIGASLAFDPDPGQVPEQKPQARVDERVDGLVDERVDGLVDGLERYVEAGVDFLEINESCPNTESGPDTESGPERESSGSTAGEPNDELKKLEERLVRVRDRFLERRGASTPVIVKLSSDADPSQVPHIVDLLVRLGYGGVNFGNTSTAYEALRPAIDGRERRLYDAFAGRFGGGVSGAPLRPLSLRLVERASEHLAAHPPPHEFHLVRTGGVETAEDLRRSSAAGASLCQWYTGYFEAFAAAGHDAYWRLFRHLTADAAGY